FYQAEDGIRVFHVTGVQTCALPICRLPGPGRRAAAAPARTREGPARNQQATGTRTDGEPGMSAKAPAKKRGLGRGLEALLGPKRSEERRVGEGWGAGRRAAASKKVQ